MGCPNTCTGYELMANLDFDTDESGTVDDDDDYPNWTPIGHWNTNNSGVGSGTGYTGTFDGNNNVISNLKITSGSEGVGLFGYSTGTIAGVGLQDVNISGTHRIAQMGALVGRNGGTVISSWATGTVHASGTTHARYVGGLVGRVQGGSIRASYADVTVTGANANGFRAGGLVGYAYGGSISASYATGNVSGGSSNNSYVGGLAGRLSNGATITASYATGRATGSSVRTGGLVGRNDATIRHSYWDSLTSGYGGGVSKATYELRNPTAYGTAPSIYAGWNLNVDGDANTGDSSGNDDPWEFGTDSQYPVLKFDGMDVTAQQSRQPSIDTDSSLSALAVSGVTLVPPFATGTDTYTATLPSGSTVRTVTVTPTATTTARGVSYSAVAGGGSAVTADADTGTAGHQVRLGGPNTVITVTVEAQDGSPTSYTVTISGIPAHDYDTDDDNLIDITNLDQLNAIRYDSNGDGVVSAGDASAYAVGYPDPQAGMGCDTTCAGYELMGNLDFDTTGNDDVADAPYDNWTPIANYASTFQGNGRTISNLTINNTSGSSILQLGLFSSVSTNASISGVGLPNASVTSSYSGLALMMAPLVGNVASGGTVTSSWATGSVTATAASGIKYIGGLVGSVDGLVGASYSGATVTATSTATTVFAGGLAGRVNNGSVAAGYATGAVSGGAGAGSHVGGLVGRASAGGTRITASYATGTATAGANANVGGLAGSAASGATTPNSYWDTIASGIADDASSPVGVGKTTYELRMPTAYGTGASIYSAWDVNVDGNVGNDDPWDFGTNAQYPILKFGGMDASAQRAILPTPSSTDSTLSGLRVSGWTLTPPFASGTAAYATTLPAGSSAGSATIGATPNDAANASVSISAVIGAGAAVTSDADTVAAGYQVALGSPTTTVTITVAAADGSRTTYTVTITVPPADYDADNDNLIDVRTLDQLNAIRYDLGGNGVADDSTDQATYSMAFPGPPPGWAARAPATATSC